MSIQVRSLTKVYGTQKAVDSISFDAPKGQITGFLGPNGAGKSTTMKIATGYIESDEGEVLVEDINVKKSPLKVKKVVGYLPEHNPLYLDMYVKEFLSFVGEANGIKGKKKKERIKEIIELCGLSVEQHKKIGALSKGYRQRVGLAKALFADPRVLILDEPTTGLDPNQIVEIRNLIKSISKEKTVILSTHIMQEVEAMCDKVVIINKGHIVADDSLNNLKSKSASTNKIEIQFEEKVEKSLFDDISGLVSLKQQAESIIVEADSENLRGDLLKIISDNNLPLISMKNVGGSLEEIFASLTQ